MITVYRFATAPSFLRDVASQGGDEDWIVVIPPDLVDDTLRFGTPFWIETMDSMREPVRIDRDGWVIFVGRHA